MGIALKELSEVGLWLEIVLELGWFEEKNSKDLLNESRELYRIISTIILNAKKTQ